MMLLIDFGLAVAGTKQSPEKLFALLDMWSTALDLHQTVRDPDCCAGLEGSSVRTAYAELPRVQNCSQDHGHSTSGVMLSACCYARVPSWAGGQSCLQGRRGAASVQRMLGSSNLGQPRTLSQSSRRQ